MITNNTLEIDYKLTNETLSKDEIIKKYGKISFAYSQKVNSKYKIIAVSEFEPQYLNVILLNDKIPFTGVDTTMDIKYYNEVL